MIVEFATELGYISLAVLDGEVIGISFGHPSARAARQSLERFQAHEGNDQIREAMLDNSTASARTSEHVVNLLTRFAEGESVDFDDVPLSLRGMSDFQAEVVAACRAIPWGKTVSYGELAEEVGHAGAARAAGTVMRKNRFPLIVPCHRVLASGGKIGGYSAAEGLTMKRRLLDMEQSDRFATSIANKVLSAAMSD